TAAVCVVLASGGYPSDYSKGVKITGLEKVKENKNVVVFHAGTKATGGNVVTNGGRVLGVTATGGGIRDAMDKAYEAAGLISWDGAHYRRDIGRRALAR
ncbi:MAG: phosphoribosylamine--glycine ligase, partial [Nitrospinae bacterium]|nr:phosphoribosylamine--glycine ligase [Nitrospinota bacterium]